MSKEASRRMWNRDANNWVDQKHLGVLAQAVRRYVKSFTQAEIKKIPSNLPIIDLGTGANTQGYFSESIYDKIIGVDSAEKVLVLNPLNKVVLAETGEVLPFRSSSTGLVTSFLSWRYLTRNEHLHLIGEINRILVQGGLLLIIDLPLNNWDYQYSSFNPDQVGCVLKAYGYEDITADTTTLSATNADMSGFGSAYSTWTTIGVVRAQKPAVYTAKVPDHNVLSKYLIPEENGKHFLKTPDKLPPF